MQRFCMHEQIVFKQNNRSWVGGDAVTYRSWYVNVMRSLCLPVSWPHKLIAVVIGVAVIEEVVTDANKMM
jgi:hypothetical protein